MRITASLVAVAVILAAVTSSQAESKSPTGTSPACKAPWGEPFGLGETIDLHVTDAKGNTVKVTYQCTENGWVKVSRAASVGGAPQRQSADALTLSQVSR
jgi:hypothetical protein